MGYYLRAFCTEGEPPSIGSVLDFAKQRGSSVSLDPDSGISDLGDSAWEQLGIRYKDEKLPILLEVNRDDGSGESLMREEIDEFIDFLEGVPDNHHRRRVLDHLGNTRFIVAAQLPTNDIDDDGFNAVGDVLAYFVDRHGAMIQADGQGFYDGDELIVELE